MTVIRRDPFTLTTTHGGGRTPEPEFRPDPDEIAAWTAANERARLAYHLRPNAVTAPRWGKDAR